MPGRALPRTPAVALVAVLAVAGCGSTGTSAAESTASTAVTGAPGDATAGSGTLTTDAPTPAGTPAGTGTTGGGTTGTGTTGGGTTGGGSTGGGTGSSGGKSGTGSTGNGPSITYFRVAKQPSCPAGTSANPIAGTPVVVEWKTGNVDSVALSVDGPGVYADNYSPSGSETLNFPCSGADGSIQRHTYLLTVRNAYGKATKTLVVSATVHDVPTV